jgi:hypothetical protein
MATKKGMTSNFISPLSFFVFGSGIRDPGFEIQDLGSGMGKNQDPKDLGSGINIPDPQHCKMVNIMEIALKSPD